MPKGQSPKERMKARLGRQIQEKTRAEQKLKKTIDGAASERVRVYRGKQRKSK